MHTKEMIMNALIELREEASPFILNPSYRGSMETYPTFTVKQIAEKIGRTPATTRKWCKVLSEEGKLIKGWKKCYFMNDPMTMIFRRSDSEVLRLRYPTRQEEIEMYGGK